MFKGAAYWRKRAELAEAELAATNSLLEKATEHLDGIELRFASRAALVSITRSGRLNRFLFVRNGQTVMIETYSTMEDNLEQWKRELLE